MSLLSFSTQYRNVHFFYIILSIAAVTTSCVDISKLTKNESSEASSIKSANCSYEIQEKINKNFLPRDHTISRVEYAMAQKGFYKVNSKGFNILTVETNFIQGITQPGNAFPYNVNMSAEITINESESGFELYSEYESQGPQFQTPVVGTGLQNETLTKALAGIPHCN